MQMAPIRRFSAAEKGRAPQEGPDPLPPKKRPVPSRRDEVAKPEMTRPWYERHLLGSRYPCTPMPGIPEKGMASDAPRVAGEADGLWRRAPSLPESMPRAADRQV